jgi:hypothetical protein
LGEGFKAHVAQAVEHFLGKEEVTGSSPVVGSSAIRYWGQTFESGKYLNIKDLSSHRRKRHGKGEI